MAFAECENGHIYDSTLYEKCPYCINKEVRIDFSSTAENIGRTMPLETSEGIGKTVPVMEQFLPTSPEADTIGKTVPVSNINNSEMQDIGKTVPVMHKTIPQNTEKTVPVFGWLVSVDGEDKGRDYKITSANCSVGANSDADIKLNIKGGYAGAMFRVCFDGRGGDFYLVPDSSYTNIYIEGEPVYSQRKLEARTCIEVGGSKFIFVAFCNSQISWH